MANPIIQKFRTNDLVNNGGKQFELGKSWCEDFFHIDPATPRATIKLLFRAITEQQKPFDGEIIDLTLSEVTNRSDRKAYVNSDDGISQIKDLFINKLRLNKDDNANDYFAVYRNFIGEYSLFVIPQLLYINFISIIKSETLSILVHDQKESPSAPERTISNNEHRQVIYYGAPGTGKSHMVDRLTDSENSIRTTFHPDSDYSTFVGAYKPTKSKKPLFGLNQSITYNFIPQAFLKAYCKAWQDTSKPFYLVIEEINRGNCAQIFGDLFQLLDRNERFYSSYAIEADDDIHRFLDEDAGEELSLKDCEIEDVFSSSQKLIATGDEIRSGKKLVLPPNLYIWATMNTSDQSLFPIDSAFKRRWDWEYVPIQYNNSDWLIPVGDKNYRWSDFQKAINDKVFHIDHLEDKMMGDWFVVADKDKRVSKHTLINKVLFYLWNDVCKDGEGDIFKMTLSDHKEHDVIFSQFFGEDALVDERLQGLMRYNKVEPVE